MDELQSALLELVEAAEGFCAGLLAVDPACEKMKNVSLTLCRDAVAKLQGAAKQEQKGKN